MTATDTTTITTFLLAQIEADEAVAREATPGPWWAQEAAAVYSEARPWTRQPWTDNALMRKDTGDLDANRANAAHIARHDPARVLATCAAHRAIVEACGQRRTDMMRELDLYSPTLRALASIYADAPGYRAESGAVSEAGMAAELREVALYGPCESCGSARTSRLSSSGAWSLVCMADPAHGPDPA